MDDVTDAEDSADDENIPRYTTEQIRERYSALIAIFLDFEESLQGIHTEQKIRFDHLVMTNVAHRAMDDIWLYRCFHFEDGDKKSNCVKRAAYFT